jgi:hypothetical protein
VPALHNRLSRKLNRSTVQGENLMTVPEYGASEATLEKSSQADYIAGLPKVCTSETLSAAGRGSMLIAAELLLMALCAALWAPDTPIGKSLRAALFDISAKTLTPRKAIIGLIVLFALIGFIISAPELVAIMGLGDLYFYLDITVISILMSTAVRLKSVLAPAIRLVRSIAARDIRQSKRAGPRNRVSHPRRPKSPPSDDEGGPRWGWAFT